MKLCKSVRAQYTARYWVSSIQCGGHICRDDQDVVWDDV